MAKGTTKGTTTAKKATKKATKTKKASVVRAKKTTAKKAVKPAKKTTKVKVSDKKKTAKKLSANKLTSDKEKSTAVATSKKVLIPSPYRFPLDMHALAVSTARYGGVFFVALGALFSLHYANLVFSTSTEQYALTANLIESTTKTECTSDTTCTNEKQILGTPKLALSESSVLRDAVDIKLSVTNATEVKVSAYNTTTKREQGLGRMALMSEAQWKYVWNTKQFDDGNYILTFFIKNNTQALEFSDKKLYKVENNPLILTETKIEEPVIEKTATDTEKVIEDTTTTTEEEVPAVASVSLKTEKSGPYDDVVKLVIGASGAQKVKLYQVDIQQKTEKLLGYASMHSSDDWSYAWNTKEVSNGEYILIAQALYEHNSAKSNRVSVVVQHTSTTPEPTATQVPIEQVQNPDIAIVLGQDQVSDTTEITVNTANATFIEMYAMNKQSAIRSYLGLAKKIDSDKWNYFWNTKNIPNGTYTIVVKVKNQFGIFERFSKEVVVKNTVSTSPTSEQIETLTVLSKIADEENEVQRLKEQALEEPEERDFEEEATEDTVSENTTYETTLRTYNQDIDEALKRLAVALRTEDTEAVSVIKGELSQLKRKIQNEGSDDEAPEAFTAYVDQKVNDAIDKTENDVRRTSKIVADRTKDAASKDSDNDGVADFDEIHLFNTDPYSADSDNDGFIDGVEILRGYDPTNSEPEAVVVFESPKETGVVREDILVVETIIPSEPLEKDQNQPPQAIISGRGLPNSYVTLYIFSTPVVVTVKTDDDGSWYYKFDKELEDGEHQVYVGITDNAGKIVAKSNPLTFIKQAEAFNEVDDSAPIVSSVSSTDTTDSLMSAYMMYLILSISVVSIGLVLILLGFFLNHRDKLALQTPEPATI